jgi:hypothetical protein
VVPSNIRAARIHAGRDLIAYCPKVHFKPYDPIGLSQAAGSVGQTVLQGGDLVAGQTEIRKLRTLAFQDANTGLPRTAVPGLSRGILDVSGYV